ncbi:hypothetical protein D6C99_07469 [Aureobasidium pullulans]|nr:hypothetical protein D6C99_07469 [Aureobasidium pullulans]
MGSSPFSLRTIKMAVFTTTCSIRPAPSSPEIATMAIRPIDYYFHVPDDHDYPVVLTFIDRWFPVSLPLAWLSASTGHDNNAAQATTHSNFSAGVKMRDRTCRPSNHSSATETAHLCPKQEENQR